MSIRPTFKYSEAFKLQVVNEIESGRVSSIHAASVRYGIGGSETVKRWVMEYGRNHLIGKVIKVETLKERDQMRELKDRIRALERLVSDQALDLSIERAYVKLACEAAGIGDIDAFKKKARGSAPTK